MQDNELIPSIIADQVTPIDEGLSKKKSKHHLFGDHAWVDYYPQFLDQDEGSELFHLLVASEEWEARAIQVFGKAVQQPRLMSWGGELPYRYSGQTLEPREVNPLLKTLWTKIEHKSNAKFNHVVINYYRDGRDHMGMHADDERELGRDPVIAALSLGVNRRFVLEPKARRGKRGRRGRKYTLHLAHGSLMVMGGDLQHTWRHGVPKVRASDPQGARLNITFRQLLGAPGTVQRVPREVYRKTPQGKRPLGTNHE